MSHSVTVKNLVKTYGSFHAVDHIDLQIENGEFFTLLGPSGCGKTTLLRMIAGFNEIDGGEIFFGDKKINELPAYQRNIGMVFQNYAVFPHMSVGENVAYGLKPRGIKGEELLRRVDEGLQMMKIDTLKDRTPSQLSGGQQQRVALARAVVIHPDILLMDEPLSNLDAKLRLEMRAVIRKIQRSVGITTIYVTHDQEEALAISDRIAVINAGKIEQVGKPAEIYRNPANRFVANFIGTSNFIEGMAFADHFEILGQVKFPAALKRNYTGKILVSVRPEQVALTRDTAGTLPGRVGTVMFLGTHFEYEVILPNGQAIKVNQYNVRAGEEIHAGETAGLKFSAGQMNIYSENGEEALG